MRIASLRTVVAATLICIWLSCGTANAILPCPSDFNCSGQVNVDDLLGIINNWGLNGVPADVDSSGVVDVDDLLAVINAWGPCVFNFGPQFPNAEAHQIGLEMLGSAGSLTLSQAMYDRVAQDLGAIRAAYPGLASQPHSMAWAPNQLLVGVYNYLPVPDFHCLNTYYQATNVELLFVGDVTDVYVVTLAEKLNVQRLATIYADQPNIPWAEPNGLIGGQNFYRPQLMINTNWRWDIDDGFHDCFDGCDCHRHYIIDTTSSGQATLVLYEEFGLPWCDFGTPK